MTYILDFIKNVFSVWKVMFEFLGNLIGYIVNFIMILPYVVTMLMTAISYLPPILVVFAVFSITISIIFLIAGRGQGG